jgi:hypothetical protein
MRSRLTEQKKTYVIAGLLAFFVCGCAYRPFKPDFPATVPIPAEFSGKPISLGVLGHDEALLQAVRQFPQFICEQAAKPDLQRYDLLVERRWNSRPPAKFQMVTVLTLGIFPSFWREVDDFVICFQRPGQKEIITIPVQYGGMFAFGWWSYILRMSPKWYESQEGVALAEIQRKGLIEAHITSNLSRILELVGQSERKDL